MHNHGNSPSSVLWPKGRQEDRFQALIKHIRAAGNFSLLDFGCGLAHLKPYIDNRYRDVLYTGADAVPAFVEIAQQNHPEATFLNIESPIEIQCNYDYVMASGVFNLLYGIDRHSHMAIVFDMLEKLFSRTNVYLSVNFMTDEVDYQQEGAYHQNVVDLLAFVNAKLSRRLVLDQSYMPYEYTLTVWKNSNITRPDNLYESV